jgi:hypothetical protein
MRIPGKIVQAAPMAAPSSITVGHQSAFGLGGYKSLVIVEAGPIKQFFPMVTPSGMKQWAPMRVFAPITTFGPISVNAPTLTFIPSFALGYTFDGGQIFDFFIVQRL